MTGYDPNEVLRSFALETTHDQTTLDRYLARYPEMATDFIDFLHDLRLSEELPPTEVEAESAEVVDAAFARLIQPQASSATTALFDRFKGKAFVELAKAVNVPRGFLVAIRDRLVVHATVPTRFINRLALAMAEAPGVVRAHLASRPMPNAALSFRAEAQPGEGERISFAKLVETTAMSDEQRSMLTEDLCDDGRD